MYVVFYGADRGGVRDGAAAYINTNAPGDATVTTLDAAEYQVGQVRDALGAQSLFGGPEWFVLDTPSANEEFFADTRDALAALAESPNMFVILEAALLAGPKKLYAKHTAVIEEFVVEKKAAFNTFALAEALAHKDRRQLWVRLQEARLAGLREEEIIGMLWWQLKALRLAQNTTTAAAAGMKDFPYSKAKRATAKFAAGEVEQLAHSLLVLYHEGHAGRSDMSLALERWVLAGK